MAVGDVFEILHDKDKKEFKLKPSVGLKTKWASSSDYFDLSLENISSGDTDLCGFIVINTTQHMGNQFGHGKQHGILIKAKPNSEDIKIIWSALPLANKDRKDKKDRTDVCKILEGEYHGGRAHASN
jgi:hypothetical protein